MSGALNPTELYSRKLWGELCKVQRQSVNPFYTNGYSINKYTLNINFSANHFFKLIFIMQAIIARHIYEKNK